MKQQISGNGILTLTISFNFHAVGNENWFSSKRKGWAI